MLWSSPFSSPSSEGNSRRWQSKLFTSSGTWTVPADVGVIWIDCCGGGAGGGSGFASETSGGGGAGGASAPSYVQHHMPVAAGETLTLTVGAGGVGAVVGAADGSSVTETRIVGSISAVATGDTGGWVSYSGWATTGGHAAGYGNIAVYGGTGAGENNGAAFISTSTTSYGYTPRYAGNNDAVWQSGGAGGGPGYAGGLSVCGARMGWQRVYLPGGAPTGSPGNGLGGGGSGGNGLYGTGGAGGAGGVAGADATGYGAGGGGGGGNAAGGNGSPGFIRIYCFSTTTI